MVLEAVKWEMAPYNYLYDIAGRVVLSAGIHRSQNPETNQGICPDDFATGKPSDIL